jgi:hypothetical protein
LIQKTGLKQQFKLAKVEESILFALSTKSKQNSFYADEIIPFTFSTMMSPMEGDSKHHSRHSSIDSLVHDIEIGKYTHTMRHQSRKLSKMIMSRTELMSLNPEMPDKPTATAVTEEETSGIAYWIKEIQTAREHGGDYDKRLDTSIRAALGAFLTFAVLIFPRQQILGAVWIGKSSHLCVVITLSFDQS